jgi:hypothetical protein
MKFIKSKFEIARLIHLQQTARSKLRIRSLSSGSDRIKLQERQSSGLSFYPELCILSTIHDILHRCHTLPLSNYTSGESQNALLILYTKKLLAKLSRLVVRVAMRSRSQQTTKLVNLYIRQILTTSL